MKVLVTGSSGLVGRAVADGLTGEGHLVVPFDILDGQDVLDRVALSAAAKGCTHLVHSAALLGSPDLDPDDVFRVNTIGTYNALMAARDAGIKHVVFLSSVNVFGCFRGESLPDSFPISDDHSMRTVTSYGIAKLLGEEMCRNFVLTENATAIALRPPAIWGDKRYAQEAAAIAAGTPVDPVAWEQGAMIDIRDMADAVIGALKTTAKGFHPMLVAADRIEADRPTLEMVADYRAAVPWTEENWCADDAWRGLLDCTKAKEIIGFAPKYHSANGQTNGPIGR
jgi:nucleoside-diphosphate-sugar epimerase